MTIPSDLFQSLHNTCNSILVHVYFIMTMIFRSGTSGPDDSNPKCPVWKPACCSCSICGYAKSGRVQHRSSPSSATCLLRCANRIRCSTSSRFVSKLMSLNLSKIHLIVILCCSVIHCIFSSLWLICFCKLL